MLVPANAVVSSARDIRCDRAVMTSSAEDPGQTDRQTEIITTMYFRERERERDPALQSSGAAMVFAQRRLAAHHLPSAQSSSHHELRQS